MIHNTSLFYYPGTRFKEPQQGRVQFGTELQRRRRAAELEANPITLLENLGRGVRGRNSSPGAWGEGECSCEDELRRLFLVTEITKEI